MDFDTNTPQMKNAHLFMMASLSPAVARAIDLELYRTTVDTDETTIDTVLEYAFGELLKDIEETGLILDIDPSDYLDDMHGLSKFLQCCELLLPNGLYPNIKRDRDLYNLIQGILDGSIGDGTSVIQVYLTEVGALDGGIAHRPHLTDDLDALYTKIKQTHVFTDYLRNLLVLVDEERNGPVTDAERHQEYNQAMRKSIGALADAVNLFSDDADYEEMLRIQSFLIKDLLAPDNFVSYSYIFVENESTIPEDLHERYQDKWYGYRASHRWCYEYYCVRKITDISRPFRMMIACVTYMLSQDRATYEKAIAPFLSAYPDPHVQARIATLYSKDV